MRLMGPGRWERIGAQFSYSQAIPEQPSESPRHKVKDVPAAERVETFAEAVIGLAAEEAQEEAARCLRCDIRDHH
jgi:hypothetical protein